MHIRARLQHRRIQLSLVDTRRVDGKVRQQHIAALGSVPPKMRVNDRAAFWDQVEQRLAKLGNRLGKDGHDKIINELAAKVPMVTETEQRKASKAVENATSARAIVKRAGLTDADIRHAIRLAQLSEDEFDESVAETVRGFERASRTADNKILKRRRSAHA
jgi:hypothetical protein